MIQEMWNLYWKHLGDYNLANEVVVANDGEEALDYFTAGEISSTRPER